MGLHQGVHPSKAAVAAAAAHVVMNSERWIVLLIGLVVSFIVALGVVEWFLHWVRKHGFTVFAIYRILCWAYSPADLGSEVPSQNQRGSRYGRFEGIHQPPKAA
jgi:hypothetical protein